MCNIQLPTTKVGNNFFISLKNRLGRITNESITLHYFLQKQSPFDSNVSMSMLQIRFGVNKH